MSDWDEKNMESIRKEIENEMAKPIPLVQNSFPNDTSERTFLYTPLARVPLTKTAYLIQHFLIKNYINLIYGDGGQGKSYLALFLAVLIVLGRRFLGREVNKGTVLYIDFELSSEAQRERLERICRGLNIDASLVTGLYYLCPGIQEGVPTNLGELVSQVKRNSFDLVIIDSIGAALTGDPESARDIGALFRELRELGTVLLLDHQPKTQRGDRAVDKTPFGSVYKFNLSRNVFHLNSIQSEASKRKCGMVGF